MAKLVTWHAAVGDVDVPVEVLIAIAAVTATALHHLWTRALSFYYYQVSPVAFPGGPKPDPLTRLGSWPERETTLAPGWRFLTAEESHRYTEAQCGGELPMLGEAAGRQIWVHDEGLAKAQEGRALPAFSAARNPNASDRLMREQNIAAWRGERPAEGGEGGGQGEGEGGSALDAARRGIRYFQMVQCEDGHWGGDYGGPMFLMPGMIIAHYVIGEPIAGARAAAMRHYLLNHQQRDGGWGTHVECASTMFGTALNYVALRLLGAAPDAAPCAAARAFLHARGGALMTTSWAKFWLALLGVYGWDGINSVPAEMWLLPRWLPFHPGRMWCHSRMVYLPMCYLYCRRWTYAGADADPLTLALRAELYTSPYAAIDWDAHRHACCPDDAYAPPRPVMRLLQNALAVYERWGCVGPLRRARARGLAFAAEYMAAEDTQTNYIDIGPVNKAFHVVVAFAEAGGDARAPAVRRHLQRVDDYLWVAEDGMKMQGYNGSQCWDTSFMLQAVVDTGLAEEFPLLCQRGWRYLMRTQIPVDEDNRERYYRHISKGGWPFSTAAHGWPISDCTGEGLKAVLALARLSCVEAAEARMPEQRLYDAVNVIFSLQNEDGGWATYENTRGFGWYESLNPSEVFGDIMIDYSYVECTSACVTALAAFAHRHPRHAPRRVARAIARGGAFLRSIQRADGSWYGSWAVCFTYGTWFGVVGLAAAAAAARRPLSGAERGAVSRAAAFLLRRQRANGGWGESYLACVNKAYPEADGTRSTSGGGGELGTGGSGVVQTAWAVLALAAADLRPGQLRAGEAEVADAAAIRAAVARGAAFLRARQLPDGDWAQEGITGVFNRSCGISYSAYRNVFPVWALGVYARRYEAQR